MNNSAQSWRDLLGKLTENPAEKQRVAEALGVNAFTVTRWVTGESEPRLHNLKRLPDVFPHYRALFSELIQADLAPNVAPRTIPPFEGARLEVPSEYLVRTLATYATTSGPFRTWSIRNLNLQQAIELLEPDLVGMEITVVQCVPPVPGQLVRSLCERIGVGSAPWDSGVGRRLLFLGAESLAGWAVGRGQPGVVQDSEQKLGPLPFRPGAYEKSAVAWPFQREGKFAGCLVVVCTRVDYFTPLRLSFIEVYAKEAKALADAADTARAISGTVVSRSSRMPSTATTRMPARRCSSSACSRALCSSPPTSRGSSPSRWRST